MSFKSIIRKPMLPSLILVMLLLSAIFSTSFSNNIHENKIIIDQMYNDAALQFEVLPGSSDQGVLNLPTYTAEKLCQLEGVEDYYGMMWCPYSMEIEGIMYPGYTVYGTNSLEVFSQSQDIDISISWSEDTDVLTAPYCIIDEELAALLKLEPGDTVTIAGCEDYGIPNDGAPAVSHIVLGTFQNPKGKLPFGSIITSLELFFSEDGLIFNDTTRRNWRHYSSFSINLNPAYNRKYKDFLSAIKEAVSNDGTFVIYGNTAELQNAVEPLEKKTELQETLLLPVGAAFGLSVLILTILYCRSCKDEVLIRLLFGEPRWLLLFRIWFTVSIMLGVCAIPALVYPLVFLDGSVQNSNMVTVPGSIAVSAITVGVSLYCFSSQNLVQLYQSKEE